MNRNKGFTLIELLIVIAVLGVLAVAVLSALNPIEQINRSRDTGSRADAEQLLGAIERFYATKGYYPWQTAYDPLTTGMIWTDAPSVTDGTTLMLAKLASGNTAEIKDAFRNRLATAAAADLLYVYRDGAISGNSTYVCFGPRSDSSLDDAVTRCAGTLPGDYPPTACAAGAENICLP